MAFKQFRNRVEEFEAAVETVPETRPTSTYIDEGCKLSGKLYFAGSVRIDGDVEGQIEGEQDLAVGNTGRVHASVRAESVSIRGSVEGDIIAQRKITLHKSARVSGDLKTAGIVIEEGAVVKGHIVIGSDHPAVSQTQSAQASDTAQAEVKASAEAAPAAEPNAEKTPRSGKRSASKRDSTAPSKTQPIAGAAPE